MSPCPCGRLTWRDASEQTPAGGLCVTVSARAPAGAPLDPLILSLNHSATPVRAKAELSCHQTLLPGAAGIAEYNLSGSLVGQLC